MKSILVYKFSDAFECDIFKIYSRPIIRLGTLFYSKAKVVNSYFLNG